MEILKWREAYETGVQEMDTQHKRLIHLVNQMYTILREKEGLEKIDAILAEMSDYAERHFQDEEELLRRYAYPEMAEQEASHQAYRQKIQQLISEKTVGTLAAAQDIYAFLRQWWIGHISTDDKNMAHT